jgi:hypothetical protein
MAVIALAVILAGGPRHAGGGVRIAVVYFAQVDRDVAFLACEQAYAIYTEVFVYSIDTFSAVLAWFAPCGPPRGTLVDVGFTVIPFKACNTRARVAPNQLRAHRVIFAWVAMALKNLVDTVWTFPSSDTLAVVGVELLGFRCADTTV